MGSFVGRRLLAAVSVIALAMTFTLGALAQESTPGHDTHHGAASPASGACAALASGTPVAGDMMSGEMMMGSPMAGMSMTAEFDLMFIDMMIVHHQGAVAMAQVALERAEHQEVRDLAQRIIASQQAEIDQMRGWREAWYPGAPVMPMEQMAGMMDQMMMGDATGMPGMAGTPGAGMEGMATPGAGHMGDGQSMMGMGMMMDPHAQAVSLCNVAEPFDRAFLEAMIPHHQSAIAMAELALHHAAHAEIQRLAQAIIDAQRAEIDQMEQWLAEWYGSGMSDASPAAATGMRVAVTQGEMFIEAERTAFHVGETYLFVVTNTGVAPHDFVIEALGSPHDHAIGHEAAPNALNVLPGETKELVWTFEEPGDYELTCRLSAHYDAGMFLKIVVTP